jgi:hypothetical protein
VIEPLVIQDANLSRAWARTFLELTSPGGGVRHPAMVAINAIDEGAQIECEQIRTRLDAELHEQGSSRCSTVAGTLFPKSMWNRQIADDANSLFARYKKAWPKIEKCPANRRGVYFRRLTAFTAKDSGVEVNQLQFIVDNYRQGNHRKSAMQAAILDPTRDHTGNRQKGFPCLQQVAFTPLPKGRLSIAGFYATQYQFEKAYGNYLGLYWLGQFMAKQLQLQLSQVVCMATVLSLGDKTKTELQTLTNDLKSLLREPDVNLVD